MKAAYLPTTLCGKLLHLAEESAELSQAILKTLRVAEKVGIKKALQGYNPELVEIAREHNIDWIKRELEDVNLAKDFLLAEKAFSQCISGTKQCHHKANQVFKCAACKKMTCWCSGGDEDELCAKCFVTQEKKRESRARKTSRAKPRQQPPPRTRSRPRQQPTARKQIRRNRSAQPR